MSGFSDELVIMRAASGLSNLGTLGGTGSYIGDAAVSGGAYVFDGTGDAVNPGVSPSLLTEFSGGFWFNPTTIPNSFYYDVLTDGGVFTTPTNYCFGLRYVSSRLYFLAYWTVAGVLNGAEIILPNVSYFGSWHHGVLTYKSGTLTAYIDGSSAGTASIPAPTHHNSVVRIGNFYAGAATDRGYIGSLDDVRLANRQWTSGEVSAWYAGGRGYDYVPVTESGIVQINAQVGYF